jgi:hypothetical protein
MFNARRSTKILSSGLAAVACASGLGLAVAGSAQANGGGTTPFIQYQAAFSGGQVGGFTAGTVIDLHYLDPSNQTTERQYCWSPAPIDQPACSTSNSGAPAQAGTQTVTARLNNGQSVSSSFSVGAANANLGTGTGPFTPPVLYTSNCQIVLSADAALSNPIATVDAGQQLGGYYSPRPGVTQVYDYATQQSGFIPSACLNAPSEPIKTYTKVVILHSNRVTTYTLALPAGFMPGTSQPGGTAIGYSLYRSGRPGTGVGNVISGTSKGAHLPFLGATVTRTKAGTRSVSITVKTTKLDGPLTLRLSASGTA